MWGATFVLTLLGTSLWAFIDAWVVQIQSPVVDNLAFTPILLGALYIDAVSLGAWSALYYAINYFLRLEEQEDRMLRLEAQAAAAQLAMLRYQLNPHFLFNTLNSISTLVLLKQTEPANAMLSRLSAFLRYTLANEPTAQVTLAQEIETLKLYLDIEKMRFEDRLRPHFEIDPVVSRARLPSLLLQPLIENAIKYAVTPQEDGADITIAAQLSGRNVRITVSDNGPGLSATPPAPTSTPAMASTGVGLTNIRDRLVQAFGEQHRFDVRSTPEGGCMVVVELPFQHDGQRAPAIEGNEKVGKA
jgi:LytS/YehU family sensor histidine kinase